MVTRRPRGTDRVTSEPRPGWGTVAPQEPASLSLRRLYPISTVTHLAGTECSHGSWDTRRSETGCPVTTLRRALGDPEPRPRSGWTRASLSVREGQGSDPPSPAAARRTATQLALGSGRQTVARKQRPARRNGRACSPRPGRRQEGSLLGGVGFRGRYAAQGLFQLHPGASVAPEQNSLSEGSRSERSRRASRF